MQWILILTVAWGCSYVLLYTHPSNQMPDAMGEINITQHYIVKNCTHMDRYIIFKYLFYVQGRLDHTYFFKVKALKNTNL